VSDTAVMDNGAYGVLMSRATRQAALAWERLDGPSLMDAEEARQTIQAVKVLVRALARQAHHLVPEHRNEVVRRSPTTGSTRRPGSSTP
jgi:hypothetical protein